MGLVLWCLGYPEQALKGIQDALTLAQEMNDPFSLAFTLNSAAQLHQYRQEISTAQEQADTAVTLSSEQGFAMPLALGKTIRSWTLSMQGGEEAGLVQLQKGFADFKATGTKNLLPYLFALLAEAYRRVGQAEAGLNVLAEALTQEEKTGGDYYEAELYRLRGELTLAQSSVQSLESGVQANQKAKGKRQKQLSVVSSQLSVPSPQPLTPSTQAAVEQEAEECFLKAIDIARKQQAKSLELRAIMSLVRLRQHQATQPVSRTTQHPARTRLNEAHTMLSAIYDWFTEGFDTKDLQEAKGLLEELSE